MGMSSSQARLLNLTARMHQIEYKAARLEAQKLQMANESTRVYNDYLIALDSSKIQYKKLNNDGSIGYADATYQAMLDNGYLIEFLESGDIWGKDGIVQAGKITITQEDLDLYNLATSNGIEAGSRDFFIALQTGRVDENGFNSDEGLYEVYLSSHLSNVNTNNNVRLMSDIDMSGATYSSKSLGANKTFDGNGHSIKGLKTALFSSASNATIKNLSLEGDVTSLGILANYVYGGVNISDVSVSGNVNHTGNYAGALAGYVSGSNITIERCSSNATVTSSGNYVGGLIGYAAGTSPSDIKIKDCSAKGSETGEKCVGGIIGRGDYVDIQTVLQTLLHMAHLIITLTDGVVM